MGGKELQESRERIRDAIEREYEFLFSSPEDDDDVPGSAIVTKVVLLAEWRGDDSTKRLNFIAFDASAERLVTWEARGLLHEALYFWPGDNA